MTLLTLDDESLNAPDLKNTTYLVTGAANGIGRALSIALTRCNASVILLDKDEKNLNRSYDLIKEIDRREPVIVHQDFNVINPESL